LILKNSELASNLGSLQDILISILGGGTLAYKAYKDTYIPK